MSGNSNAAPPPNEEELRDQLRSALRSLSRREPLEATYKRLLMQNGKLAAAPTAPRDKTYRRLGTDLRSRVERFMAQTAGKDPFDRLSQRLVLDESNLRAAFTLREAKEHEQQALLEATLASLPRRHGMDPALRKRHLDAIALGLQSRKPVVARRTTTPTVPTSSHAVQTEQARRQAELDRERAQARARETARQQREEDERRQRSQDNERKRNHANTQEHAMSKWCYPIFNRLWTMEFAHLGGTNPFRMVIDRENCASLGAPDYFDVVAKAMNLTYIQRKLDAMEYQSEDAFTADVDLMLNNAILYNSDVSNPYRIAAEEMRTKYKKALAKLRVSTK
jgi:hypothetical protein